MGIMVSQKMQVTGGLVGYNLGKGESFLSDFGHNLGHNLGKVISLSSGFGLSVLPSELDRRVRFSCVAVIL